MPHFDDWKTRARALVLGLAVIAAPVAAQEVDAVLLGPGDVVTLKFQGREVLNDDYRIGTDGELFLPGIGAVRAAGHTAEQVIADLESLMRETFGIDQRTFSFSVTEFRPVYVGGRVEQPGSYTYRPGLRVAQAVAMAGGERRLSDGNPILSLEKGREAARLAASEDRLADLQVRRAELRESAGLPEVADDVRADRTRTDLRAELQAQLSDLRTEIDGVRAEVLAQRAESAGNESEALGSQIEALRSLLEIATGELSRVEEAGERGIVSNARVNEIRRTIAATSGDIGSTVARRFAAESSQRALSGEAGLIDATRRLEMLLTLAEVETEIGGLEQEVRAARALLDQMGGRPDLTGDRGSCGVEVWRTVDGVLRIDAVDQVFALQPGDFVRLVERTPEGTCDDQER